MGFYGDLYTNLTTFFHNFKMKGASDSAITFPESESILRDGIVIQAAPERVYDSFNIESGNRWIQFVPEVSELKNPDGSDNYSGVAIYHALPQSANAENDITNEINFYDAVSDNIADLSTSTSKGGYLKVQTSVYDAAGHLKSVENKYFNLPNVDNIKDIADQAKAAADQAVIDASNAITTANNATAAANNATSTANSALTTANAASTAATAAQSATEEAKKSATAAENSAKEAAEDANTAIETVTALRGDDTTTTISDITGRLSVVEGWDAEVSTSWTNNNTIKSALTEISRLIQNGENDTTTLNTLINSIVTSV